MHDPFKISQPTGTSFPGGRPSAYRLWRVLQANGGLPSDTVVCFANTGKEVEATLRFVGGRAPPRPGAKRLSGKFCPRAGGPARGVCGGGRPKKIPGGEARPE